MQRGLFLDVVVGQRASVLQLLPSKDQALLVGRDALFVLNFCFHGLDRIAGLDIQRYGFSGKSFDKNLHCRVRVSAGATEFDKREGSKYIGSHSFHAWYRFVVRPWQTVTKKACRRHKSARKTLAYTEHCRVFAEAQVRRLPHRRRIHPLS